MCALGLPVDWVRTMPRKKPGSKDCPDDWEKPTCKVKTAVLEMGDT